MQQILSIGGVKLIKKKIKKKKKPHQHMAKSCQVGD